MLERLYKRLLDQQIAEIRDNPDLLRQFLRRQNRLTDSEVAQQVKEFTDHIPEVGLHYPRKEANFPRYTILMEREQEHAPGTFLGDFAGLISQEQADSMAVPGLANHEVFTVLYLREYSIEVYALHPDMTITLYELAKLMLLRARTALLQNGGVWNFKASGDKMVPLEAKEWGPDFVFRRKLMIQAIEEFCVSGSEFPPFTMIDGAFVEGGTTVPPPGVKTLVSPYVADVSNGNEEV